MDVEADITTRNVEIDSFDTLLDDLTKEIELRNYRVTRIYDIDNVFEQTERGIDHPIPFEHYKIVEFCNLSSCVSVISTDLRAGVFMPLKFTAYTRAGSNEASLAFLKPTAFAHLFDSPALAKLAVELEADMTDVLDELSF